MHEALIEIERLGTEVAEVRKQVKEQRLSFAKVEVSRYKVDRGIVKVLGSCMAVKADDISDREGGGEQREKEPTGM